MDAIQFLKTVGRICKANNGKCDECPLDKYPCNAYINCIRNVEPDKDSEEMVNIADGWAKDHPVKTRQSEFLKMFPNAPIDEDNGILCIRPCDVDESIGCTNEKGCYGCRRKYWLTEVTGND